MVYTIKETYRRKNAPRFIANNKTTDAGRIIRPIYIYYISSAKPLKTLESEIAGEVVDRFG